MSRPMLARNLETGIQLAQGGARDSRRQLRPTPARGRVGPSDVRGGRYNARELARRRPHGDFDPSASEQSPGTTRSEEHTSELQSQSNLVCRLLLEKKKQL